MKADKQHEFNKKIASSIAASVVVRRLRRSIYMPGCETLI